MEFDFQFVIQNWKKNLWNNKFRNHYEGKLRAYGSSTKRFMFGDNCKYITIGKDGVEYGFARIENHSRYVKTFFTNEVWCIEEIFIEPQFRHKGCAKALICHLRDNFNAYMIYMQKHRALRLTEFHDSIGFSIISPHQDYVDMVNVFYDPSFGIQTYAASNDNDNYGSATQEAA